MKGERKIKIAFLALIVFMTVAIVAYSLGFDINLFALGGGIGTICGVIIYGYYKEYQFKNSNSADTANG